jgi:NOL1/NOP2/fmu family ribosome biogenesis protein|tara:strand:+ start:618 stop:1067 length:450 start_codon:yes stop_codon:yes gene_type:complete
MALKILNNKEKKKIVDVIKEQYNIDKLDLDYVFLKNNDNKVFILSKDFSKIDIEKLRVNSFGLYFAKIHPNGIRLSIEGSQLIGKLAKKNVLDVNEKEINLWVRGNDISTTKKLDGFVIIKSKNDYFGSGYFKQGNIQNMISKDRRIKK